MEAGDARATPIVDAASIKAHPHPRFRGILVKGLLTSADNPFASANIVQVPVGGVIGLHRHAEQVETIYLLTGDSIFTLGGRELPFRSGQIVAVPMGVEHGLRNIGAGQLELLTFFTPPVVL